MQSYFDSGGESLAREFSAQRDAASSNLAFEEAAAIHARLEKLKPILSQFPEIVRRLDRFSALIIQPCHLADSVNFFRVDFGMIHGPTIFCIQTAEHTKVAIDGIAGANGSRRVSTSESAAGDRNHGASRLAQALVLSQPPYWRDISCGR